MSFTHYDLDINPPHSDSTHGNGVQASNDNRCLCCDSPKWCFILDDGNAVVCGRTDVAPSGWEQTGTAKDGRGIYAKIGTRQRDRRYEGLLPNPNAIVLETRPKANFPQWVEIGSDHLGVKEVQIEFLYPDPVTGQPLGKVVRKQWEDRRRAYNNGRDTKHLRPHHWVEPYQENRSQLLHEESDKSELVAPRPLKVGDRVEILLTGSIYKGQTGILRRVFKDKGFPLCTVHLDSANKRIDYRQCDVRLAT